MNSRFGNSKSANLENMRLKNIHVYKEDLLMKIIYKCKKATPNNFYFFFIFFILKLLGNAILSHNFRRSNTTNDFSINKIFRVFTYFQEFSIEINSFKNYGTICIAILIISIFPLIMLAIIYKLLFKLKFKYIKITKRISYLIKFCSILISIVVFFSQHLLEILSFIYVHTYSINNITSMTANKTENLITINNNLINFFYNFDNNLMISKYFFILVNTLTIIIIFLIINYYFVFINEPFLNSRASIRLYHNKTYLFFLIISFNFQILHYLEFIFKEENKFNVRIILLVITIVSNFYFLIDNIINYNFRVFYNKLLDTFFTICFVSCILDLIIYYSYPEGIDTMQNIFKIVVEIILALILNFSINEYKIKRLINVLNHNLFSKNKMISLNSLFVFTDLIQNSLTNSVNFLPIFKLIDQHKIKCQIEECPCEKYEFNNYLKNFDINRDIKFLKDEDKLNYFKKVYHDIITLAENEIVNMIYQYYKGKDINNNYNLFLLHIDYIFHFKRNNLFSNYLIEQYSLNIKSLPFIYKFYFFIYKKALIKQHHEYINAKSSMTINSNFLDFFKYYKILVKINKLVLKNCENFEKLIYIKKTFDNNRLNSGSRDASMDLNYQKLFHNIEKIFVLCEDLNKNYKQLIEFLEKNFKTQRLRNVEVSYILFNFFFLINKEIPFDLRSFFLQIDNYAVVEDYNSSYAEKKICHPIIINVNRSDSFLIKYISQKLCDIIEYKKNELVNEDIHRLIPSVFLEQHKTILKKVIFLENDPKIQKESFLITKHQYYYPINLTSSFLPTINENTLLIIDIFPIKDNPNSKTNIYKFILDRNANFITFSKNFVENFCINLQMFNKLRISFCQFFNINFSQLSEKFKNAFNFIEKLDLSRTNSIMKIFQHVDLMRALEFLNEENNLSKKYSIKNSKYNKVFDFIRKKEKLIPTLIKIKKKIQEDEMDQEYLHIINELEKKFYRHTSTNKIVNMKKIISKTLGKNMNPSNHNENSQIQNSVNNIVSQNLNTNNISDSVDGQNIQGMGIDQFYIRFQIMNMGNIPYFYVQLYEKKENEFDLSYIKNLQISFGINQNINEMKTQNSHITINESHKSITDVLKFEIPINSITESSKDFPALFNIPTIQANNVMTNNNKTDTNNSNNNNLITQNTNVNTSYINNNYNYLKNTNSNNHTSSNGFLNLKFSPGANIGTSNNSTNPNLVNLNSVTSTNAKDLSAANNSFSFNTSLFMQNTKEMNNFNNTNKFNLNTSINLNNSLLPLTGQNTNNNNESLQQLINLNRLKSTSLGFSKGGLNNTSTNNSAEGSYTGIKSINDINNFLNSNKKYRSKRKHSVLQSQEDEKSHFKAKIIFILLFILLFIQIFLAFFSFYFKNEIANVSFDLFNINYYALLTKLSVYYTSSSALSACSYVDIDPKQVDKFSVDISDYKKNFKTRSDELLTYLYKFMNFLSGSDSNQINEIMTIISEPRKFKLLYTDWTSYHRNSNILDEMSYYHYYIAGLQRKDSYKTCRLRQFFYYELFEKNFTPNLNGLIYNNNLDISNSLLDNKNEDFYQNNNDPKNKFNSQIANFEESVLYYIVYNVFQVFRERLELITLKINNKLITYHNDSQKTLVMFNLIILFFGLALILIVIFSVRNYRSKIIDMIFSIFIKDKADKNFEERLINFKTIVKDLDKNVCIMYEENCKKLLFEEAMQLEENLRDSSQKKESKNKNNRGNKYTSNYYGANSAKDKEKMRERFLQSKKRFNNNQLNSNNNISNYDFNNNLNESSSTNNINNNNNNGNGFYSSNNNGNNNNNEEKNEEGLSKQNLDLGNISMRIIRFSYMVLFIAIICYIVISVSNILINNREYRKLILANQISVNFLDRIPKFAELILYFKISVIFNNVNFITTNPEDYENGIYSNYFDASYDKKSDTLFRELGKSEYAHIYYKLKIIRKNIDLFMGSKEPLFLEVLNSLREYESKLNSQDFCLIYSTYYLKNVFSNSQNQDLIETFKNLNKQAQECMIIGNGINKYGLNLAIDSLLASTNNLYLDFSRAKENANITQTLTSINFLRAVLNIEYTFQKANSNYLKLILDEMTTLYDSLKNIEYIYSLVGLFFNLLFIIIVIFGVIKKLQQYFISLGSAIDKFKIALITNSNNN